MPSPVATQYRQHAFLVKTDLIASAHVLLDASSKGLVRLIVSTFIAGTYTRVIAFTRGAGYGSDAQRA